MADQTIPAFPRPFSGTKQFAQEGMTLRDYFAAKAMQALLAKSESYSGWDSIPVDAYEMADEMLKAREQ